MNKASVLADHPQPVEQKGHLLSTGMKYGAVAGVIFIILFLVLYFMKENPLPTRDSVISSYLINAVIISVFVFFTLKEVRDYHLRGSLTFAQGMTAGLFCYTTLALISALFVFIFLSYADTALLVQHQQESLVVLTGNPQEWIEQVGQQAYDQALEEVRNLKALDLALDSFLKKILIGLFLTGIITLIVKK